MRFLKCLITLGITFSLYACSAQSKDLAKEIKPYLKNLDFTCVHETKPPLSPETQQLYQYARWHDLHKLWKGKQGDWDSIAVYYRIAAANGDYKANLRLQYLLSSGRAKSITTPKKEVIDLNEQLEKILPATAYYNYYTYLSRDYGIRTSKYGEFTYLRKAADLGNHNAQNIIGDILSLKITDNNSFELRKHLWEKFYYCAAMQGNKNAAKSLGIYYRINKKYSLSLEVFHQGTKNGNDLSARALSKAFSGEYSESEYPYLALSTDKERSKRYEMIEDYLYKYDYLNPTVPDLDDIVPLPPAKLPPWDGKIAFQRWYEGPLPAKPSDELLQKLAKQAGLDWQTGFPLKK